LVLSKLRFVILSMINPRAKTPPKANGNSRLLPVQRLGHM